MAPGSRLTMSNAVALGACLRMKSVPMVLTDFGASSTRIRPPPGWVPTTCWLVTVMVSVGAAGRCAGVEARVVTGGVTGALSFPDAMPGPMPSIVPSATVSIRR